MAYELAGIDHVQAGVVTARTFMVIHVEAFILVPRPAWNKGVVIWNVYAPDVVKIPSTYNFCDGIQAEVFIGA